MASAGKTRHYLPLKDKVEVIKKCKEHGMNHRALAEKFNCGKTQIGQILKNKESIMSLYKSNRSARMKKLSRVSTFEDVNKALFEWYSIACSKNIYPGGHKLWRKQNK